MDRLPRSYLYPASRTPFAKMEPEPTLSHFPGVLSAPLSTITSDLAKTQINHLKLSQIVHTWSPLVLDVSGDHAEAHPLVVVGDVSQELAGCRQCEG